MLMRELLENATFIAGVCFVILGCVGPYDNFNEPPDFEMDLRHQAVAEEWFIQSFSLEYANRHLAQRIIVSVDNSESTPTIGNRSVFWMPTRKDVGFHKMQMTVSYENGISKDTSWRVCVTDPWRPSNDAALSTRDGMRMVYAAGHSFLYKGTLSHVDSSSRFHQFTSDFLLDTTPVSASLLRSLSPDSLLDSSLLDLS